MQRDVMGTGQLGKFPQFGTGAAFEDQNTAHPPVIGTKNLPDGIYTTELHHGKGLLDILLHHKKNRDQLPAWGNLAGGYGGGAMTAGGKRMPDLYPR
jgi:hypothetical protein